MDLKEFQDTVTKLNEEREKVIREQGQAALGGAFKELFDKWTGLESVTWTQYTPYFNDGDECTFSVNGLREALYQGNEQEEPAYASEKYNKLPPELIAALNEIERAICSRQMNDAMKLAFGDHARITAKRDGEFDVTEYSHD